MPRKKREASPTGIYHWIVRGMNKKKLFHHATDYSTFEAFIKEYQSQYHLKIYHYCYMTNHVHMLIDAPSLEDLSSFSHYVQRRYAYYYCKTYKWTGSVFQRGYKSFIIDRDEYLLECGRYIERNPLKAQMVEDLSDYIYTSFRYYVAGEASEFLSKSPAYIGLSLEENERRELYKDHVLENRIQEEMMGKGLLLNEV